MPRLPVVPNRRAFLSLAGCLLVLGACGGGSGDDEKAQTSGVAAIAGLYDFGVDVGDGVRDEIYLEIRADGSFVLYDYLGDTFDQGPNCYARFDELGTFIARGDDRYAVYDPDSGETAEPEESDTVRRTDEELVVTYSDVDDDDGDGDVAETVVVRFPAVRNISSRDFTICTSEQAPTVQEAAEPEQTFDDAVTGDAPASLAGKLPRPFLPR